MIGLQRHTVRLEEHQEDWSELFKAEAAVLSRDLGSLISGIEHVGSTAVPGLIAKPIIDIAVSVTSKSLIHQISKILVTRGYIDRGDGGNDGGYLFVKESVPDVRIIHLHIVELSDPQWRQYIGFRECLRKNPTIREQYAALKRRLADRHPGDRKAYTDGKNDFIRGILKNPSFP